jgi:hypothetical protein
MGCIEAILSECLFRVAEVFVIVSAEFQCADCAPESLPQPRHFGP